MRSILLAVCLLALVACGDVKVRPGVEPDAGVTEDPDGGVVDPIDAAADAPPLPPPPPGTARELAVTAGTVTDPRFVLQLEVTGGVAPRRATGAAVTLDSATTVTVPRGGN